MKLEMMAGYADAKGVPMAKTAVILSGAVSILGGLGIIFGVYVKIAIALLALFLIVVTLKMHNFWKTADPMVRMNDQVGFMKNTALLGADLMFLAIEEPWIFSWLF